MLSSSPSTQTRLYASLIFSSSQQPASDSLSISTSTRNRSNEARIHHGRAPPQHQRPPAHARGRTALTAGAGALAGLTAYWLASRPSYDSKPYPRVVKAPKPAKEGPLKYDVYPSGRLVNTPMGRINVYLEGPADGKKLLLVHGISTPSAAWSNMVPLLVQAGYQVLMYDLMGRGYSDAPLDIPYDAHLFTSQIAYVLAAFPDWDRFDLVGMSLGGPIATTFAHYFPQRVKRLYLLCPAGGTPKHDLPFFRRFLLSHYNPFGTELLLRFGPLNPRKSNDIAKWQCEHAPGFIPSFAKSLREGPIFGMADSTLRQAVKGLGNKVRAIWGDADDIVPMHTKKYWGEGLEVDVVPGESARKTQRVVRVCMEACPSKLTHINSPLPLSVPELDQAVGTGSPSRTPCRSSPTCSRTCSAKRGRFCSMTRQDTGDHGRQVTATKQGYSSNSSSRSGGRRLLLHLHARVHLGAGHRAAVAVAERAEAVVLALLALVVRGPFGAPARVVRLEAVAAVGARVECRVDRRARVRRGAAVVRGERVSEPIQ